MRILLTIIISCITYSFLNHQLMDVAYNGLNLVQSAFRSLAVYSAMFIIYGTLPITISLLVAKLPKLNRVKPYYPFFKVAIIITWFFAGAGLFFGWYGVQAINS